MNENTPADRVAAHVQRCTDEIIRVMGEDWWTARPDAFDIAFTEIDGQPPLVQLHWLKGSPGHHFVALVQPGVVAEAWPATERRAPLWTRDEHGERRCVGYAEIPEDEPPEGLA
jgi:nicotinamidase-related amidase